MIKIVTIQDIKHIIQRKQLKHFFVELVNRLRADFSRWPEFKKTPRHATHYPHGVIELMPISDETYYSFKYVNGHPYNPQQQKLNVVAVGMLAQVESGYPVLISEMTLLTALRTAATSALASSYLSRPHPVTMAIIGTGSQAEFQVLAHHFALGVQQVHYYDTDPAAMTKFAHNLAGYGLTLIPFTNIPDSLIGVDIITTATAAKAKARILEDAWIYPGLHINAIGGDCPGKTELDPAILTRSRVVVENLEQTRHEGEIQHLKDGKIDAELWEITSGKKPGRQNPEEICVFDSVGFALEDYTTLRYIYELADEYQCGQTVDLIPKLSDPKNLFSLLTGC
jgi:ornithine cyclodeaminase